MSKEYDEEAAAKRRQELKKRLLSQQEKENHGGYQVNEYGEIIRETVNESEGRAGVFALIISFIFPLIGVFIYFINKGNVVNPNTYLYAAGLGFVFGLLLSFL